MRLSAWYAFFSLFPTFSFIFGARALARLANYYLCTQYQYDGKSAKEAIALSGATCKMRNLEMRCKRAGGRVGPPTENKPKKLRPAFRLTPGQKDKLMLQRHNLKGLRKELSLLFA